MPARVIFMGTPDFAVPALQALIASKEQEVVAVVTQPDRPKGRGKKLAPPPVKVVAEENDITVLQPPTLKIKAVVDQLATLKPDVIVVAAFGQILKKNVLNMPPHGCINIHASLLPRWRGASPITAAIRAGDAETGVTIMKMDVGLDTGPMIIQKSIPITATHTGGSLTDELAQLGASLLIDTLPNWLVGKITPQPQDDALATLALRLEKQEGALNWTQSAAEIERQVRAFSPWPGTYTTGPRGRFKVISVAIDSETQAAANTQPGTVFKSQKEVYVNTGEGVIQLLTVQPMGKKVMPVAAMLNGQPELLGSQLGSHLDSQ